MASHRESSTSASRWPALVARTSGELLGRRPLPRVIADRAVVFVLGPPGVGKTVVARRLLGPEVLEVSTEELRRALLHAARHKRFPDPMVAASALLLERVDYLDGRIGPTRLLGQLLADRAAAGRRTAICQGSDTSCTLAGEPVALELRATLLLRFPVGRGRRRHVVAQCRARGVSFVLARDAVLLEPWTYTGVAEVLDRLAQSPSPEGPSDT